MESEAPRSGLEGRSSARGARAGLSSILRDAPSTLFILRDAPSTLFNPSRRAFDAPQDEAVARTQAISASTAIDPFSEE
jgi:hypothetical protein